MGSIGYSDVAVIIPCLDEAAAITGVVDAFHAALPGATVYVYDNGSTDDTVTRARAAGATVHMEPRRGKGSVMKRMFADIEAETFVMVDGDATYDAADAPEMVRRVREDAHDMVIATRIPTTSAAYRPGHTFGNRALRATFRNLFGTAPGDLLSGYRALSRRLVKSFPARSTGFEIETELSVHASRMNVATSSLDSLYSARPPGSTSKLRTYRDGARILTMIARLIANERPFAVWSTFGTVMATISLTLGLSVIREFDRTGLVPRFPTAFLAGFLMLIAVLCVGIGLILHGIRRVRIEQLGLAYLALPAPRPLTP